MALKESDRAFLIYLFIFWQQIDKLLIHVKDLVLGWGFNC